ncbi:MAG: hypothetical protein KDA28_02855, partial [Phycisphaerales bacterium]|nr:hypothetical protein [Phycisphaerales bacterium]
MVVLIVSACGDDDDPNLDGGSASDGGILDGGTRDGDAPRDADAVDGEAVPDSAMMEIDAGPACTPREEIADPIVAEVGVNASCMAAEPCASTLPAGELVLASLCLESARLFPEVLGRCSAATESSRMIDVHATVTVDGSTIERRITGDVSALVSFPNACHGCRCQDLETQLVSAGINASCNPVCAGGTCFCNLDGSISIEQSDTFTDDGSGTLMLESGQTLDYCASEGGLTISGDAAFNGVLRVVPPDALLTPEICDGLDNDGNGSVDDDMLDCPVCNDVGVCGDGFEAICMGRSGYECSFTSPAWEAEETLCDMRDNDCDGMTDEELDCRERCNG